MASPTVSVKASPGSPITPEILQKTVSKIGVKVPEHLVDGYIATLTGAQHAMEVVMAMDDFVPVPDVKRFPRTNVYLPSTEENQLGAWAWKVTVKNIDEYEAEQGLLAGKTVCLKDNICLAGVPCLLGTEVFTDWVPNTDATVVMRILESGGTIVGKGTSENFAAFGVSNTAAQGPVGNPYDPSRSAGGSSSGTGVLIATGEVDMGIGGDQGGSIRLPAANLGIVGLKPTYGLVPYTGIVSSEVSIDHTGPMSPDIISNALLLRVIAGIDGIDDRQGVGTPYPSQVPNYHTLLLASRKARTLLTLPDNSLSVLDSLGVGENMSGGIGKNEDTAAEGKMSRNEVKSSPHDGTRKVRIGVLKEGGEITGMDERVLECVKTAARKFEELGAEVVDVSIPGHLIAALISRVHRFSQANNLLGRANGRKQLYLTDFGKLLHPWTQDKFDKLFPNSANTMINGLYADEHYPELHGKCHNLLRKIRLEYDAILENVDILVMPTTPYVAKVMPHRKAAPLTHFNEADGLTSNTQPFNHTGHPALSIPCGMLSPPEGPDSLKLPVGMQLVGRHFDELTLYKAGLAWSDKYDWKSM